MCWQRHSKRFAIVQDSSVEVTWTKVGSGAWKTLESGNWWDAEDEMKREAKDGYGKTSMVC